LALISRAVRIATKNRLAHASTGFTPRLETELATASFVAPPNFVLPIQFDGSGYNFFEADINPQDLDETSEVRYPFLTLFTPRSRNQNLEKFSLFAGPVAIQINVFASWMNESALPDFETFGDCVESAMYGTFNDQALRDWANIASIPGQANLVWNGNLAFERSRVIQAGENWLQSYSAQLAFEAHVLVS
jgi:hypothetical protein